MATGISFIDTLLPSFAYDTVAVFNESFEQIFVDARSVKGVIKEQAKVMEHPLETGSVITDHMVLLPVEIELSVLLTPGSYQDTYKAIRSYFQSATLLVVQTRTAIYPSMLISSMPHDETPEQYDAISMTLSLRQALFVMPAGGITPANPSDSNTVDRGQQGIIAANATQIALAVGVFLAFNKAGGNFI